MAWFSGKVSLGNFPDLAGAVNKISESVKNIEKNFDNALGFEEKSESSGNNNNNNSNNEGQRSEENTAESSEEPESLQHPSKVEKEGLEVDRTLASAAKETSPADKTQPAEEENKVLKTQEYPEHPDKKEETNDVRSDPGKVDSGSPIVLAEPQEPGIEDTLTTEVVDNAKQEESTVEGPPDILISTKDKTGGIEEDEVEATSVPGESHKIIELPENTGELNEKAEETIEKSLPIQSEESSDSHVTIATDLSSSHVGPEVTESADDSSHDRIQPTAHLSEVSSVSGSESVSAREDLIHKEVEVNRQANDDDTDMKEQHLSSEKNVSDSPNAVLELEKLKKEMKMMEAALQGAARQAQAKADEIAKFMNENEQLKAMIDQLKINTNEAEIESLREEYHQRVSTLERKVYALTRERDTLRREQSRKSDAAALLKEKDEIITQVMAEGEELSKKQAAQEGLIRKLRAQVRELEEEKKGLMTRFQVEENKVESVKRDKAATESLLQETIEKHQSELAVQKEYYTNALSAAKEAEALAEARANSEARTELESRLREAVEREAMLVQALEELRQTLSRNEQQAAFREDMLRRDIEDLQKRYQASERRCEELITQVPDSTRPLLRQIEAMQETTARRAEAWAAVERSLNSRLQEAEAKAAGAEERERSVNERLSQTLSRINVLEAQISCLRAEQTQLSRSLEKERQRAAENRQEYLAAKEEADTQEGRVNQLEEQIREIRRKHKQDLQEAIMQREMLQQEVEKEKAARLELEKTSLAPSTAASEQTPITKDDSPFENGSSIRKYSSASSLGSMEESFFLQASLDSSDSYSERKYPRETTLGPYYMKSITPSAFEASLRQKEGELQSYMTRLASMESIRDSLAEELVKMTEQCEKLRAEAIMLPGIRAELDALRRRHSAALELMGERDEELEELRADIVDLKEMYREQVNMLVNKIQVMSGTSMAAA